MSESDRGSHKQELSTLNDDVSVNNVLGSYTHRDEDIDQSQIVDIVLKPGGECERSCFFLILSRLLVTYSRKELHEIFGSKRMRTIHIDPLVNAAPCFLLRYEWMRV